jgi:uncharacterized cupin superfamily protein
MPGFAIVRADDVDDAYAGSDVPGEFHKLTDALGAKQLSVTLIRVPPHSDMEQSTGHTHSEIEELYIVAKGTITFRCGDDIEKVTAPAVVRVSPGDGALASQRGRRAGRDLGRLAEGARQRRDQDRRLLGGVPRRQADPLTSSSCSFCRNAGDKEQLYGIRTILPSVWRSSSCSKASRTSSSG